MGAVHSPGLPISLCSRVMKRGFEGASRAPSLAHEEISAEVRRVQGIPSTGLCFRVPAAMSAHSHPRGGKAPRQLPASAPGAAQRCTEHTQLRVLHKAQGFHTEIPQKPAGAGGETVPGQEQTIAGFDGHRGSTALTEDCSVESREKGTWRPWAEEGN